MAAEESDVAVLNLENELPASADRDSPLLQEPEPADDGLDTPKKVSFSFMFNLLNFCLFTLLAYIDFVIKYKFNVPCSGSSAAMDGIVYHRDGEEVNYIVNQNAGHLHGLLD